MVIKITLKISEEQISTFPPQMNPLRKSENFFQVADSANLWFPSTRRLFVSSQILIKRYKSLATFSKRNFQEQETFNHHTQHDVVIGVRHLILHRFYYC